MNALRIAPAAVVFLVACSGTGAPQVSEDGESLATDEATSACVCSLDQVCDSAARCIARPAQNPAEMFTEIELLQQVSPLDDSVLRRIGDASAAFNAGDPLPADTRTKFTTDGGEDCFFEVGTNYPSSYGEGKFWPSTPGLDAGKLTFAVTGAAGPIELDPFQAKSDWGYLHGDKPPALKDTNTIYPDFFNASYLPAGKGVNVEVAGGPDVSAHRIAGELPKAFTITSPAVESPNATATLGADLPVTWSPAQPSAFMEIFMTMDMGGDVALVSCKVKDDGKVVIPAAVMGVFIGDIGLQLRRTTERYTRITQHDGKVVNASVLGRHARLGTFLLAAAP